MKFQWILRELAGGWCYRPKQRPSLRSIFGSFISLWVEIRHRNRSSCSESSPVQSNRSKQTFCPRKERLLRLQSIQSNSTTTSDVGAQKLGNDVWHDSGSIATKVCNKVGRKWKAMFESHVEPCIDWTSFDSRFEDFFSNLLLKIIIYCVTDQPSITRSRRSVLNFKFSVLTFPRLMGCSMSITQKLCEVKISQLQPMSKNSPMRKFVSIKSLLSRCIVSVLDIQLEKS